MALVKHVRKLVKNLIADLHICKGVTSRRQVTENFTQVKRMWKKSQVMSTTCCKVHIPLVQQVGNLVVVIENLLGFRQQVRVVSIRHQSILLTCWKSTAGPRPGFRQEKSELVEQPHELVG